MQKISSHKPSAHPQTLSISQLNRQARRLLEGNFSSVAVEGEISNLSRPSSGHWYFTLKDSGAQVRCAMFRSANARLRFQLEPGQMVVARAKLSLYEARGDYQLIVDHLQPAGDGALALAFEQLKQRLQQQGLFDASQKQPPPDLPRHIAVITSPTGAAIRDILSVLGRRFPGIPVTILPTPVQGQDAAPAIVKALNIANQLARRKHNGDDSGFDFDVILLSRGGGSIEDLWAFNEEVVARAIVNSQLPVISAVGHETDFTITDFVADVRAPTPSAAAELLSPDGREIMDTVNGYERLLRRQISLKIEQSKSQLVNLRSHLRHPGSRLQEHSQRLDELELRLRNSWNNQRQQRQLKLELLHSGLQQQTPGHLIEQLNIKAGNLYHRLERQIQRILERQQQRLNSSMQLLDSVSPLATLDRGYAIVTGEDGVPIDNVSSVAIGQQITTRLAKGWLSSTVNAVNTPAE